MTLPAIQNVQYPSPVSAVSHTPSSGGLLVSADGRALPLKATRLVASARAGRARVTVEQRFVNVHSEPLAVTYQLPLPADGAVAGFDFVIDGQRVVGQVQKRADAREQYGQALAEGRTAALLEQDRSSVFRQELGNIAPGAEVLVCVRVDQPLAWLSEGAWEWRFPCVVAPRYLGQAGRVKDASRLVVEVNDPMLQTAGPSLELGLVVRDALTERAVPVSPSHALNTAAIDGEWRVSLAATQHALLDRDVVVRWAVAAQEPGITLDATRVSDAEERAFGLLTVVPPAPEHAMAPLARDLILLLDTSGSMHGAPLSQAKRVSIALVNGLTAADSIEIVSFGSNVKAFQAKAALVTDAVRAKALAWIDALQASGGTEMRAGIAGALASVREESQRQVLLVTDGLIGFETEVIADILARLPESSRLHTLGIGSAVNRSLTGPAARAGRGSEHLVDVDEEVEPVLKRILAKLEAPLITNLRVSGAGLRALGNERLPDLHAGSPVCLALELVPSGGKLLLQGETRTGIWRQELNIEYPNSSATMMGSALATAFGRERVEELELRRAAGGGADLDREVEALGMAFAIATRMTSWVAVRQQPSVDPSAPTRHVTQPQALPYALCAEGMGLRPVAPPGLMAFGGHAFPMAAPMAPTAFAPPPQSMQRTRVASPSPARPTGAPSPKPQAEQAKGGDTLLGSAKTWLGRVLGGAGPGAASERDEALPVILTATIVVQSADRLILNAAITDALQWTRPTHVTLQLADGTHLELELDPRSTASSSLQVGQSLRLWLTLSAALSAEPVALTAGSLQLRVTR